MCRKPKHIAPNAPLSSPHPDQEPHSSASAGSHLQTSLKWKKCANYWLDTGGISNRNKYYAACSCVGVVQHWRTRSSWYMKVILYFTLHILVKRGGVIYEYFGCRHTCLSEHLKCHFIIKQFINKPKLWKCVKQRLAPFQLNLTVSCEYLFKFQNLSGVQVCEEKQLLKAIRQSNTI